MTVSPLTDSQAAKPVPLMKVFTPHAPIQLQDLLRGRTNEVFRALDALHSTGQQVVLYGDRGVGKTSLARVVAVLAQDPQESKGTRALFVSCDSNDTFSSIWEKVFQEVLVAERKMTFGRDLGESRPMQVDIKSPNDVRLLVKTFQNPTVIVLDEFDRVPQNTPTRQLLSDTIKLFSDNAMDSKIMVVGVARTVEELFAAHESLPRHAAQIPVEPMALAALAEIIQRGFRLAGLTYDKGLDTEIARLSQGYPHYTHLLGLWSGRRADLAKRAHVTRRDLEAAIPEALENAIAGVRERYEKAVRSAQPGTLYKDVLLACAMATMAKKDPLGKFATAAVRQPLTDIRKKPYDIAAFQTHLAKFTQEDHGRVLVRTGKPHGFRWQFDDPQMIPYVLIEGVREGKITATKFA